MQSTFPIAFAILAQAIRMFIHRKYGSMFWGNISSRVKLTQYSTIKPKPAAANRNPGTINVL
jgi:ribulose-5-phosphate 4-epimerase/fuculose-1-phosphate aldolase